MCLPFSLLTLQATHMPGSWACRQRWYAWIVLLGTPPVYSAIRCRTRRLTVVCGSEAVVVCCASGRAALRLRALASLLNTRRVAPAMCRQGVGVHASTQAAVTVPCPPCFMYCRDACLPAAC